MDWDRRCCLHQTSTQLRTAEVANDATIAAAAAERAANVVPSGGYDDAIAYANC